MESVNWKNIKCVMGNSSWVRCIIECGIISIINAPEISYSPDEIDIINLQNIVGISAYLHTTPYGNI